MTDAIVTTQQELDKALKAGVDWIEIRSAYGVWLEVRASDSSTVMAYGSATVRAYDSSTVRASGSSAVMAYGSSTVMAYGSATVRAYDSSTVRASDSSAVMAYDSSTVRASDSATVMAYGSATVRAYGSATVRASGSATVMAYGSSTVMATKYTAVHLHSASVTLQGGTVIDHTKVDLTNARTWCKYHGVTVVKGLAYVYKAVNDQFTTDRGFDYSAGAQPSAPDWKATDECGNGLHFGPTPVHALRYFLDATHFMLALVELKDLVPISGGTAKCKAPAVVAPLVEVSIDAKVLDRA